MTPGVAYEPVDGGCDDVVVDAKVLGSRENARFEVTTTDPVSQPPAMELEAQGRVSSVEGKVVDLVDDQESVADQFV